MRKNLLCTITLLSVTQALFQGFNSGASFSDGSIKQQADFEKKILSAKEITGCSANSVRLYTSIVSSFL